MIKPSKAIENTAVDVDGSNWSDMQSTGQEVSNQAFELGLIEVLTQLAYRKRLIAKVTGVTVLIGLILCFVLPAKYTATIKIMTPQQSSSAASLMSQFS